MSHIRGPTSSLYIGNIPHSLTEQQLTAFLADKAPRHSLRNDGSLPFSVRLMIEPHQPGRNKGFAFMDFNSVQEANEMKSLLSHESLEGRRLRVNYSDGGGGGGSSNNNNTPPPGGASHSHSHHQHQHHHHAPQNFHHGPPPGMHSHQHNMPPQQGMMPPQQQQQHPGMMPPQQQQQHPGMPGFPPPQGAPPPQQMPPPIPTNTTALPPGGSYYPGKIAEDDIMRILMKVHPNRLRDILAELSTLVKQDRNRSSEILSQNPNFCISVLHMLYLLNLLNIPQPQQQAQAAGAQPGAPPAPGPPSDPRLQMQQQQQNAPPPQQPQQQVYRAPAPIQQQQQQQPAPQSSIPPEIQSRLNEVVKKLNSTQLKAILDLPQSTVDGLGANQKNQVRFIREYANYLKQHIGAK